MNKRKAQDSLPLEEKGTFPLPTPIPQIDVKEKISDALFIDTSRRLGGGSYGVVFSGTFEGKEVAVKFIPTNKIQPLEEEISLEAKHSNVIAANTIVKKREGSYIIMEKAIASLENFKIESESDLTDMLLDIVCGMEYLHKKTIIHADLKPGNVVVFPKDDSIGYRCKIVDFGLCIKSRKKCYLEYSIGTRGFMAPEVRDKKMISAASDVYSFGKMVQELANRMIKTQSKRKDKMQCHIALAEWCMHEDPEKRPTFTDIRFSLEQDKEWESKPESPKSESQAPSSPSSFYNNAYWP
jgi:serine/threonine protein kinase